MLHDIHDNVYYNTRNIIISLSPSVQVVRVHVAVSHRQYRLCPGTLVHHRLCCKRPGLQSHLWRWEWTSAAFDFPACCHMESIIACVVAIIFPLIPATQFLTNLCYLQKSNHIYDNSPQKDVAFSTPFEWMALCGQRCNELTLQVFYLTMSVSMVLVFHWPKGYSLRKFQ